MLHSKGNEQRSSVPSVLESFHLPLQAHPHLSPPSSRRLTCTGHTGAPLPSGFHHQQKTGGREGSRGRYSPGPLPAKAALSCLYTSGDKDSPLSPASPRTNTCPHCTNNPFSKLSSRHVLAASSTGRRFQSSLHDPSFRPPNLIFTPAMSSTPD